MKAAIYYQFLQLKRFQISMWKKKTEKVKLKDENYYPSSYKPTHVKLILTINA